jgi:hypothetical protein
MSHTIVTRPPGTDSAPYLIALVHNSWMAIDKATALLGCTRKCGPAAEKWLCSTMTGSSVDRMSLRKVTPRQFSAVSVSVAQGAQARLERLARIGLHIPKGLTGNGLNRGERILDPMLIAAASGSNDDWNFILRFKALCHTLSLHGTGHPDPRGSSPGAVADGA